MKADIIVKVGGSLYDLPDLGPRLATWLAALRSSNLLLVPGGGASADLVRAWDRQHNLGEETAHWLALRTLTLNAHFLTTLLPGAQVVPTLDEIKPGSISVLDMYAWSRSVDNSPARFPHTWDVTSDSLAVQVANFAKSGQLFLLKSVRLPDGMSWHEAAQNGIVDAYFPKAISATSAHLQVRVVPFRGESHRANVRSP